MSRKRNYLRGIKAGIPISLGYFAVSITLGIAAKNAGLPCVSVTWGFRDRDVLEECGAGIFADDADTLEREIRRILDVEKGAN